MDEQILPLSVFMGIERNSPIPLYFQVSSRIEQAILDGTLPAGARVENEIALGNRLGLSRPTIRRAIQDLVDKGLLVRRRGIGTQVVHGQVNRGLALTSLHDDLRMNGKAPSTRILAHHTEAASTAVANQLSVAVGSPVVRLQRVRYSDGVPVAILENWLPQEFSDLVTEDIAEHGLYQVLRSRGVTMCVAKQRISARISTPDEGELLDTTPGDALLTMERTAFDNSGKAVEFGQHCYRPDLYAFSITLVEK